MSSERELWQRAREDRVVVEDAVREHRVEHGDVMVGLAQQRSDLQGRERRIRLGAPPLLLVEAEEIGMSHEHGKQRETLARNVGVSTRDPVRGFTRLGTPPSEASSDGR